MANRWHNLQIYRLVGQQPQRPLRPALRRRTTAPRHPFGFGFPITDRLAPRRRSLLALQRRLQALLDKPPANIPHRIPRAPERLGTSLVAPGWTVRIDLQENMSMIDLVRGRFPLADQLLQLPTFRLGQSDNIPLGYGSPPLHTRLSSQQNYPSSSPNSQN